MYLTASIQISDNLEIDQTNISLRKCFTKLCLIKLTVCFGFF